jgi:membrane protease YdiL (CAAX protease family)
VRVGPLSSVEGSYSPGLGFGTVRFWLTHLMLAQLGVLYVWLTNGSGGSVLMAILTHAGFNMAVGLRPHSTTGDAITFLVLAAATVGRGRRDEGPPVLRRGHPRAETTVGGDPHAS